MDTATEELYFQKLQELVFDNDKIVTIPFLARTLNISVQESQELIQKFTEDQHKLKPDQLSVTYVLTGSLKHDNGRAVLMITELDLEEKRSSFEEILSEVIFSVQKCKNIDFEVISLVDKFNSTMCEKPLMGVIVGSNSLQCEKKIKKLPPPPQVPTIKGKSSFFLPKNESNCAPVKESQPTGSSETKPSGGIANIFSKASTSNVVTKAKSKASENKPDNKPKGGLSGFLKKSSAKPSSDKNVSNEESLKNNQCSDDNIKKNESTDEACLMDIVVEDETGVEEVKDEAKFIEKSESRNSKKERKSKQNNKRQREKSQEKPTKRRKRIVERDDSESDDMFKNDSDEDIVDKSEEEPDRVPSPVEKKPLAPKNKIRRAVDKTYEDEEGFVVTKTEYVYESAPEDENATPVQNEAVTPKEKKIENSSKKSVSSEKAVKSKKGKKSNQNQPTLMNFFKKK